MADTEKVENKICHINRRLLPIKFHYFFYYGALGAVMSYLPLFAKELGINATATGLIYTLVPFCVFFSKPLFGYLTDYFRNIKIIVFILTFVTAISYFSLCFFRSIHDIEYTNVNLKCVDDQKWLRVQPTEYDKSCLEDALQFATNCEASYYNCDNTSHVTLLGRTTIANFEHDNTSLPFNHSKLTFTLKFEPNTNFTCDCIEAGSSRLKCSKPIVNSCFMKNNKTIFETYKFWLYTLLVIISGTAAATVFCLSDAACYEVLGDNSEHYGRQRLSGTVSWGITTLLAGYLNDMFTGDSDIRNYTPGFYLMLLFLVIDLLLLLKVQLTKAKFSVSICKDISKIFASCKTITFAFAVYIIGALTGFLWSYEFWYLQDIGATQTLLGLATAMQCLAAEVPFFFFSGWFIKTLGHFNCISATFGAFTVRLGLYYVLKNPWFVLPIEILHGVTFAVFYSSMTSYASECAPPGTEATMMGILGGLFEGLGVATGSLLGGVGFDQLGGRYTFLVGCIISLISMILFTACSIISKYLTPNMQSEPTGSAKGVSETSTHL